MTPGDRAADRARLRQHWYDEGCLTERTIADRLRDPGPGVDDGTPVFVPAADSGAPAGARTTVRRADIVAVAERTADGLRALGVRPGEVVALQAATSPDTIAAMAAVWLAGAVPLPLATTLGPRDLRLMLAQGHARAIVVPGRWRGVDCAGQALSLAAATPGGVPSLGHVVVLPDVNGGAGAAPAAATGWNTLLAAPPAPAVGQASASDDVCLLIYTSGTTSLPKGVQHTHNSLLASGGGARLPAGRTLASFPSGHIAGLLGALAPLLNGGLTVVMERWSAAQAAALVEEFALESSAGTPFFLATLLDEAERAGRDVSSLRRFLTGAASVPPALLDRVRRAGILSWRSYGSTEHPLVSSGLPGDPEHKRHHTDGRVAPGNEVRLVGDDGTDASRQAPPARSSPAGRGSSSGTATRASTTTPSCPAAGSAPVTSAGSTRTGTSPSPTARRTSSSAAGRTSPPGRSRTCWPAIPGSPRRRSARSRTRCSASGSARSPSPAPVGARPSPASSTWPNSHGSSPASESRGTRHPSGWSSSTTCRAPRPARSARPTCVPGCVPRGRVPGW